MRRHRKKQSLRHNSHTREATLAHLENVSRAFREREVTVVHAFAVHADRPLLELPVGITGARHQPGGLQHLCDAEWPS